MPDSLILCGSFAVYVGLELAPSFAAHKLVKENPAQFLAIGGRKVSELVRSGFRLLPVRRVVLLCDYVMA